MHVVDLDMVREGTVGYVSVKNGELVRILFTAPRYHTNQHYPVKALLEAGHEVRFFVLRRGRSEEYSALRPRVFGYSRLFQVILRVFRGRGSEGFILRFGFPPVWQFIRECRVFRPSAVIVRDPNTAYGVLALMCTKALGAKVIFYTQGPKYRKMTSLQLRIRSIVVAMFDAQWITPVLGKTGPNSVTLDRIHYVPFVVAPGTPPSEKRWAMGAAVRILAVGKFQKRKNPVLLLRALSELSPQHHWCLTIVGECSTLEHQQELQRVWSWVRRLGLEGRVEIKINLPFAAMQQEYANHDLFVLPSSSEPAAVSILEAMAHSLPVIGSDSNGTACYVEQGGNGYIFRSDDLQDLVEKVSWAVSDRSRLVTMGERSYQLVLERHRPAQYAKAILEIIGRR